MIKFSSYLKMTMLVFGLVGILGKGYSCATDRDCPTAGDSCIDGNCSPSDPESQVKPLLKELKNN